jgi:hypothetical protein
MLHQVWVIKIKEEFELRECLCKCYSSLCDKSKKSSSKENVYVNVTSSLSDK